MFATGSVELISMEASNPNLVLIDVGSAKWKAVDVRGVIALNSMLVFAPWIREKLVKALLESTSTPLIATTLLS